MNQQMEAAKCECGHENCPIPPHKCNGVDGAKRHGYANACTVCGRFTSALHDGCIAQAAASPTPDGVPERDEEIAELQSALDSSQRKEIARLTRQDEENGAEIMRLKTAYDAEVGNVLRLTRQLETARDALEHYADEMHWQLDGEARLDETNRFGLDVPQNDYVPEKDGFEVAAKALKEIKQDAK